MPWWRNWPVRKDDITSELPGVPRRPGRPPSGKAKDDSKRSQDKRARLLAEGKKQISITLSLEVIDALKKHIEFKDLTLGDAVEKALRDRFLRKR